MPNGKPYAKDAHADTVPNRWNRMGALWWARYRRRQEFWRQVWREFGWN